jgi:hypothetical protein
VFVRTSTRRNQDGTRVSYLQLAHNEWDPTAKTSRTKVLYSFGRADQLDRAAIERLITALTRVVGIEPASAGAGPDRARVVGVPGLEFVESRPLGGAWLLDRLWHRLGIDTLLRRLAAGRRRDPVNSGEPPASQGCIGIGNARSPSFTLGSGTSGCRSSSGYVAPTSATLYPGGAASTAISRCPTGLIFTQPWPAGLREPVRRRRTTGAD